MLRKTERKIIQKKEQGITLIALIVTVIVLLILAAITIPMLIGENSLIFRAKEAKKETKREVIIERIELSTLRSYEPDGTLKIDPLKENIHEDIPEAIIEGDEFPIKVKVDDVVVIIDGEGDVVLPKDFTVTLSQYSYIYDGIEKRPEVTVKEGEKILQEGIDYKVKYINNIEVGTATVIVTGQGDYEAIKKVNFVIQPVRMATVTKSNKTYNGKEQTGITGENINVTGTEKGIDAGKYTVTVKPITDYTWADGTTEAKIIEWEIVAKSINVEWEDKTVFLYNGKEQAPSASATSGVSGEVINIERTTAIEAGEHTSTASISSVTGGRAKKENYILIGNTKQYEINGYSYTIKYNGNGETQGVTEDSEHFYEEEKQLTPNGFTRSYVVTYNHNYNGSTDTTKTATYTFNGWATTAEGEKVYDNNQKVINLGTSNGEIVNLYANWSSSSVTYNPTREGYTFTGWYKEAECTNKVSEGEYIPTANITLYAKWTVNSYTATFNSNGGTTANPATITKQYGAQLGTLPTTSRVNYTFAGWFTAASGGTQILTTTTMGSANVTYYAHWVANPSATITANPVSTTVVAGNAFSFSVAATGNGTLSYQWYSATSSTAAGTAITGATSATYTATSSSGLNGKYYYCVVTSKVDSSTKTATSGRALLTVQAANYSIVKSNVTTYYNTLATAIAGATSGGGDAGGGTITVLNNVTDTSGAAPNKTITINTNGKTLTRNSSITPTAGTLTVSGSGTIDCIADNPTIYSMGGNIIVSSATIIGLNNAVGVGGGYAGTITITGATIYSTKRSAVFTDRNRKYYNN